MHFIVVDSADGSEPRVNVHSIVSYVEAPGDQTIITLAGGITYLVTDSCSVIDAQIKSIGHGACVVDR